MEKYECNCGESCPTSSGKLCASCGGTIKSVSVVVIWP